MYTYLTILGRGIRENLHLADGAELAPVLASSDGQRGLTAQIGDVAEIIYVSRPEESEACGAQVYIKTAGGVLLQNHLIVPPKGRAAHVHTNTHHAKSNAKAQRLGSSAAFKPVVSVRATKSAPAQLCMRVATLGPSLIIYAAPHSGIAPMPCGAYVWLQCAAGVEISPG